MATMSGPTFTRSQQRQTYERFPRRESQPRRSGTGVNVSDLERWASLLGGGALTAYGLARRDLPGLLISLLGGAFAYRGLSGHCPAYGALGFSTAEPRGPVTSIPASHGVRIEKSIVINRSPEDL
jgi:uncharacterized membrane protein